MRGDSCNGMNAAMGADGGRTGIPDEASRPRACLEPGRNLQGSEGTGRVVRQRSRVRRFRRHVTDQGGISLTGKIRAPAAGDHAIDDPSVVRRYGNTAIVTGIYQSSEVNDGKTLVRHDAWSTPGSTRTPGGSALRPKPRQSCTRRKPLRRHSRK
jgi:hypothetical protein